MTIKNFDKLATSVLRRHSLMIAESGYRAINTKAAIERQVSFKKKTKILKIQGRKFNLADFNRVVLAGFGKAALDAAAALRMILKDEIDAGYVIDLKKGDIQGIKASVGTHPNVSAENIQYTREMVSMLEELTEKDLAIVIVSGGGSAFLEIPYKGGEKNLAEVFRALTKKGADINEINTVRKHLSRVKGGWLAKIIYPASCISLIFSDVPGDDISMVASGPTVRDKTGAGDAARVAEKYKIFEDLEAHSLEFMETPKDQKYFIKTHNFLLVSGMSALSAMSEKAEDLGYKVKIFSKSFGGEAKDLGPEIIRELKNRHQCLLGIGESAVKIIGSGMGGRNMEMALAALANITEEQTLVCLASDGHDNTESAGAIVDASTRLKARKLGLNIGKYLKNNDSFSFFEKVDDAVFTGLTGSNVSDFFVALAE